MKFEDLVGETVLFYGVDARRFKLDDTIWEAEEDESDGYRSCLEVIEERVLANRGLFFNTPITAVVIIECGTTELNGYELRDADGHIWLQVGTDNSDDYYPSFVFYYTPKETPTSPKHTYTIQEIDQFDQLFTPREV